MEHSRDEVQRQLSAGAAEHTAAMAPWRDALLRVFGSEKQLPASARAELNGAPSRRGFLKIGGATVLGAAVVAACGYETGDVAESGAAADRTSTTADPAAGELDLQLARTATSLEILAVETYQAAIDSGLINSADLLATATLFRDQHDDHRAALEDATVAIGGEGSEYTLANTVLQDTVIGPAVDALTDETSVIELALLLETTAAETYTWMAGQFSTVTLRQSIMGIGGVEARHMAVLRGELDEDQVPVAFLPTDDRLGEDAFIEAEAAAEEGTEGEDDAEGDTTTTTVVGDETTTTTGPQTTTSAVGVTTTSVAS